MPDIAGVDANESRSVRAVPSMATQDLRVPGSAAPFWRVRRLQKREDMQGGTNRYVLGALLGFIALNAFAGGYYALAGAEGVPVEWLEGSGFSTYVGPGLILFVIVGGAAAIASIAMFANARHGRDFAKLAGWILVTWLSIQIAIIGFVSWMQPATAAAAVIILAMAYRAPRALTPWRTA